MSFLPALDRSLCCSLLYQNGLVRAGCQYPQLAEMVKLCLVARSSRLRRDRHRKVVSP